MDRYQAKFMAQALAMLLLVAFLVGGSIGAGWYWREQIWEFWRKLWTR